MMTTVFRLSPLRKTHCLVKSKTLENSCLAIPCQQEGKRSQGMYEVKGASSRPSPSL